MTEASFQSNIEWVTETSGNAQIKAVINLREAAPSCVAQLFRGISLRIIIRTTHRYEIPQHSFSNGVPAMVELRKFGNATVAVSFQESYLFVLLNLC